MSEKEEFGIWGILELMGHVKLAGYITEEELFGKKMGRIDIPHGDGDVTQYFGGDSVYRLTPCTEDTARKFAVNSRPLPVYLWELSSGEQLVEHEEEFDEFIDDEEDEEPF